MHQGDEGGGGGGEGVKENLVSSAGLINKCKLATIESFYKADVSNIIPLSFVLESKISMINAGDKT